jgi:hypothetical protein
LNDVYVQYVDYNGALWNATGNEAASSTTEHKTTPWSNYASTTNEFWVLLQVQDGGQSMSGLSVQRFDGSGTLLLGSNALNLFPVSADYYQPYTINDDGAGAIVSCGYGTFGQVHLLAEKIDYSGNVVWPGIVAPLCAVNSNKDDVSTGKFNHNNLVFVWQDDRDTSGVFAQNIHGDGQTGIYTNIKNPSKNKILFYPNPSQRFSISSDDLSEKQLTIYDVNGKKLFSATIPRSAVVYECDYSPVAGFYHVIISDHNSSTNFKWIKTD